MAFLAVANRIHEFDTVVEALDSTQADSFDPQFVPNSIAFPSSSASITKNFPSGATNWTWVRFNLARVGSSMSISSSSNAIEIRDGANNLLASMFRASPLNGALTLRAHGTTNVDAGTFTYPTAAPSTHFVSIKIEQIGIGMTVEFWTGSLRPTLALRAVVPDRGARGAPRSVFINASRFAYVDSLNFHVSEFAVADHSLIGSRVIAQVPASAGAYSEMTGPLADLNDSSDVTGIITDAAGERMTWEHSAYAGPERTLDALVAIFKGHREAGTPSRLASMLRTGGVDYFAPDVVIDNPTWVMQQWPVNPATGLKWTTAELAGLQAGLRSAA